MLPDGAKHHITLESDSEYFYSYVAILLKLIYSFVNKMSCLFSSPSLRTMLQLWAIDQQLRADKNMQDGSGKQQRT